ncbi:MAG: MFS transporter, partial [Acidimicrobiia bacterium]
MPSPTPEITDAIHEKRWFTLGVLCLSLLIIVMDNTILNVAIPSLVRELGATNSQLQWIIDGYVIVFAGLLLTSGTLGDKFGRKRMLRLGIAIFITGSVAATFATSPIHLILARSFMGAGGSLIMPSTLSILTNVFRDPVERGRAIAIWAGFAGVGVAIGPITGGLLLQHFSWESVFWVNVPIGIVAIVAGHFFVPRSRDPDAPPLDPVGALLSIVGFGVLLYGIIHAPDAGWASVSTLLTITGGLAILGTFLLWEWKTEHPMLQLGFFSNPRFSVANLAVTLVFFGLFGSLFLMTQFWQFVQGYSALQVGIRLIPYAAVLMVVSPRSARLVERFGTKRVMTVGLVIAGAGLFSLSFLHVGSSYMSVITRFCLLGTGMSMTMAPATESIMGSLPRAKAGVGSAMNDTTRQVGGALGVAVIGSVFAHVYGDQISRLAGFPGDVLEVAREGLGQALGLAANMGGGAGAAFSSAAKEAFLSGLAMGLRIGTIVLSLAALAVV